MIDPSAEPIDNRNPYRRVDLSARRYPKVITEDDYNRGVIPDEALYVYDISDSCWHLKETT
jgi:hypothetical protein